MISDKRVPHDDVPIAEVVSDVEASAVVAEPAVAPAKQETDYSCVVDKWVAKCVNSICKKLPTSLSCAKCCQDCIDCILGVLYVYGIPILLFGGPCALIILGSAKRLNAMSFVCKPCIGGYNTTTPDPTLCISLNSTSLVAYVTSCGTVYQEPDYTNGISMIICGSLLLVFVCSCCVCCAKILEGPIG